MTKTTAIKLRITEADKNAIKTNAKDKGMTMSEYIRFSSTSTVFESVLITSLKPMNSFVVQVKKSLKSKKMTRKRKYDLDKQSHLARTHQEVMDNHYLTDIDSLQIIDTENQVYQHYTYVNSMPIVPRIIEVKSRMS